MTQLSNPSEAGLPQGDDPSDSGTHNSSQGHNVGQGERAVSIAAGGILAALGISRGTLPGLLIAGVGGALVYRGVSGSCPAYKALGISTADDANAGDEDDIAANGVTVRTALLVNKPADELYRWWRDFANLPKIMTHLESVTVSDADGRRSHWVAKGAGPLNKRIEWDAELTDDLPGERIGWRSLPGADITNGGVVRFEPALGDRGTVVHVTIRYVPPGGKIGHFIASMLGQNPKRVVREDVRNFKRLMEVGEILTIIGQSHGSGGGEGSYYTESEWRPLFT